MASLSSLLSTLTDSLTSATASLPDTTSLAPPTDGISLLDLKTELLLSYLHNLIFLILLKLRDQTSNSTTNADDETSSDSLTKAVTHKLIELRIYLEKGVRPLESRLKYQLDKLLLAASDAPTTTTTPASNNTNLPQTSSPKISPLSHRPNPSAFTRPSHPPATTTGPYRPPHIHPTSLPTASKPRPSSTLTTFIAEEMTSAPLAEPSIGASGSFLRGKEREKEEERRAYEEMRLVRLPGEKKGKGKRRRGDGGGGEDLLGGLGSGEWGNLGNGDLGGGKKRRRGGEEGGGGRERVRVGERWERRVERGVGRKRQ